MTTGIYKILNKHNNKCYIGSASISFQKRFNTHKHLLKKNKHYNKLLQNSWNKYNEDNFIFEILERCEPKKCIEREQYYIDLLHPFYNLNPIAGSRLGVKASKESRLKMSLSHKGKKNNRIYVMPVHLRKQISDKLKGNKNAAGHIVSEQTKELIQQKLSMRKITKATKRKLSQKFKGINNPFFGKKHDDITKKKMSDAYKRRKFILERNDRGQFLKRMKNG